MRKLICYCLILLPFKQLTAQEYFPTNHDVKNINENYTVFTNAIIHISPTESISNGTLIIQNKKIISTGTALKIPKNSIVVDLKGKHIYPSFIDLYSNFGIQKSKSVRDGLNTPQYDATRKGYYWNDHIMPDQRGFDFFKYDSKKAEELLNVGFGVVNTHQQNGIMRGTGVLVALNANDGIIGTDVTQHISFNKSVTSKQFYPTSIMGSMALLRQVYNDATWYASGNSKRTDLALKKINDSKNLPIIFDAGSLDNTLRAGKIANEFELSYIIKGNGFEYEAIEQIKKLNISLIVPINFPKAYDVSDTSMATLLNLQDMRQWNQAPSNLSVLAKNKIPFALTTSNLKSVSEFKTNLLKSITYGLDEETALAALTTVPAKLLGKSDIIGTLRDGSFANFLITSDTIFKEKTVLYENWVQGSKNVITDMNLLDIRGSYTLKIKDESFRLKVSGEPKKLKSELKLDTLKIASNISFSNGWIQLFYTPSVDTKKVFVRLSAAVTDLNFLSGKATLTNGEITDWSASKNESSSSDKKESKKNSKRKAISEVLPLTYPNVSFGFKEKPKEITVLYKNVTVWTNEKEGILEDTDVLVKDGVISKIGQGLKSSKAIVVDGTGKHLTSGIIDEHSHIGASSINEAGHNSTAEVSIEDVINPDDINLYRNLSGGVTTIQILHGSANPIGGRSAVIKLKWGESAESLLYEEGPKFIKFALGENVKQSNWSGNTIRFPQTRMGVEQLYIDYFQRAKEYGILKGSGKPYRKDIELETLLEILNKERFISCHSYVQSEINMLMKVAEQFDFNINTFTHILEGYKVADKMREHGVGGATFSDWWAYKYEVNDAIPYNGAIMHSQGVTVAFNSDDAEMSRRLNQEAAKAIKYGGLSEEEAWKFVTLNPAKLLHIDDKVGSVKVGKSADLVLWSAHPMSIYAKAEQTMIEGVIYFDINRNEKMNQEIISERNTLINMMLQEKNKGMETQIPVKKVKEQLHCDTVETQF
jgi:imidazolonepropionase-like amidohydrolase